MEAKFEYTLNLKKIFDTRTEKLQSYYSREDITEARNEYIQAPTDAKQFRIWDLKRMCDARDMDLYQVIEDETLLEKVPTREEMKKELLQIFVEMYSEFPKTSNFMERIVRCLAPEYKNDTVRLAILKKFLDGSGENFKRFHVAGLKKHREELNDSIFDEREDITLSQKDILFLIADCMVKYRDNAELNFAELNLQETTAAMLVKWLENHDIACTGLSDSNKVLAAVKAVKEHKIQRKEVEEQEELISQIEKDFREQLRGVSRVQKNGEPGNAEQLYVQAKRDKLRAKRERARREGADPELLAMCNDLAEGNFRVTGKTKVYLYYFAFMFGMTLPLEGKECPDEKNLAKNLFQDFYCDNLLRTLEGIYVDESKKTQIEKEPTGEGINYKNFAEAIYLYYLCRDDLAMCPGEKIDAAEAAIVKCVQLAKSVQKKEDPSEEWRKKSQEHTAVYRDHFLTGLLNKTPDEVPDYIVENYIVIPENKKNPQRIQIESEERTAKQSMIELIEQLDKCYSEKKWDYSGVKQDLKWEKSSKEERKEQEEQRKKVFLQDQNNAFRDVVFRWNTSLEFEKNFPEETEILSMLKKIEERLNRASEPFQRVWRDRVFSVLHILARPKEQAKEQSLEDLVDSPEYFSRSMLQTRLEKLGIVSEGSQILDALKMLSDMGYDIVKEVKQRAKEEPKAKEESKEKEEKEEAEQKTKDEKAETAKEVKTEEPEEQKKGTVYYSLGKRVYDDEMLQKLLTKCQKLNQDILDEDRILFLKVMLREHKITRSELLSWHFNVYCYAMDLDSETGYEDLYDFPTILEDYKDNINPVLEGARYQPLSEKNILDVYVILTLYFYFIRRVEEESKERIK